MFSDKSVSWVRQRSVCPRDLCRSGGSSAVGLGTFEALFLVYPRDDVFEQAVQLGRWMCPGMDKCLTWWCEHLGGP